MLASGLGSLKVSFVVFETCVEVVWFNFGVPGCRAESVVDMGGTLAGKSVWIYPCGCQTTAMHRKTDWCPITL